MSFFLFYKNYTHKTMKLLKLQPLYVLVVILFITVNMYSQTQKKALSYSKYPYWIEMINDPHVNYFEAVKAYDEFWANRKQPKEEDDIIGQSGTSERKKSFLERFFKYKEEREEKEFRKYAFEVKKFKNWKRKVFPYVQEDGSILDAEARLKLLEEQKQKQ